MLDDNAALAAAAAAQTDPGAELVPNEIAKADSSFSAISDSLKNLNLQDIKGIVTGENTLLQDALGSLVDLSTKFVPKLLGAILVLWIGLKLIKMLKKTLTKLMDRQGLEKSLSGFLISLVDVVIKVLLLIMVMDIIGIKATSFIAILGAAGLAVGMALQGTLQNFAGGVIIMIMKPFKVGDYINGAGYEGVVKHIKIFNTEMLTVDNKTVIIPNTSLATGSLINYSTQPNRRVDITIGIAYGESVDNARRVILDVVNNTPQILKDPSTVVFVQSLSESSVDLTVRAWTKTENYWDVFFSLQENIYNAFNEKGVEIPFPQITVHTAK